MVKAEQKKNENISEYIIHMFKTEDLIRTFEFDLNRITKQIISNIRISNDERKELILWYASIIEDMQSQKIENSGHLIEINNLIEKLLGLHNKLETEDEVYKKISLKAEPFIKNQIEESQNTIDNPIIICLNAIYGFLLLKLNGKIISEQQQQMLETFGDLLSYLNFHYQQEFIDS
jgi:uncharacterized protein DUF4924